MLHAVIALSAAMLASPAPESHSAAPAHSSPAQAPPRTRVLREGSHLVQVRGAIDSTREDGWRIFRIAPDHASLAGHEFALLPSSKLAEMQRMIESLADHDVVFEITGEVFVFRGRNYLLVSHAPLVGLKPSEAQPQSTAGSGAKIEPGAPEPTPGPVSDHQTDSAQDIASDLERDVGPAVKSSGSADPGGGAAGAAASTGPLVREGTMLLQRRGRIVRDTAGSWSFVFDADAAGASDPPMAILPCLMLERMESVASRPEGSPAMLVSGRVLTFAGRNWLLPTLYRLPVERTPIKP